MSEILEGGSLERLVVKEESTRNTHLGVCCIFILFLLGEVVGYQSCDVLFLLELLLHFDQQFHTVHHLLHQLHLPSQTQVLNTCLDQRAFL